MVTQKHILSRLTLSKAGSMRSPWRNQPIPESRTIDPRTLDISPSRPPHSQQSYPRDYNGQYLGTLTEANLRQIPQTTPDRNYLVRGHYADSYNVGDRFVAHTEGAVVVRDPEARRRHPREPGRYRCVDCSRVYDTRRELK